MPSTIRLDVTPEALHLLRAFYELPPSDRARFVRAMQSMAANQRRQRLAREFTQFMVRVHFSPAESLPQ